MINSFIVATYFITTLIIGLFYGKKVNSLREFAVAEKNYSNAVMIATLFATVIGGVSTSGVASKTFSVGIIFVLAFYGAAFNKIMVAQFVAPKISRFSDMISVGDIMGNLYGRVGKTITGLCITLVSIGSVGSQVAATGFV